MSGVTNPARTMDDAVDRLVAAYAAAGLPPIRRARGARASLATIRAAIAPLRLPAEVEQFWRRVDPESITVAPYPHPIGPAFALRTWVMHRDEAAGMTSRLLFPVAYESHGFLFVELEDGRGSGGAVLQWAYGGEPFAVRFPTLSAYVDLLATMIELDEFTRDGTGAQAYIGFDPDGRWDDALTVRLAAAQPLRGFENVRTIDEDILRWPERWLLADGLTPDARALRGATTTIAELMRRAASGSASNGTVRATVTSLAGSGAGRRITIDDGTGRLDVWCPAAVCAYGPSIRTEFEFDVVVRPMPDPAPDWGPDHDAVQASALAHDLASAQEAAMNLYAKAFQTTAAAEATAVRPIT